MNMTSKNYIAIIISIAVIFFFIGYAVAGFIAGSPTGEKNKSYQAGWDAARQKLADSGFLPSLRAEIKSISGKIKAIDGHRITLETGLFDPLADESLTTRTVIADESIRVYSLEQRDQNEFMAALDDYNKKIQTQLNGQTQAQTPLPIPEMFNKKEIAFSDLKIGDNINVSSSENIKEAKEFRVTEINLNRP